jgi:beta-glucuronidase
MLYPQSNPFRQSVDLSGFWDFRFDPEQLGMHQNWVAGFDMARPIAVPASWNDQFEDQRDYLGDAWYQTTFDLPRGMNGQRLFLRFGSVNYLAEVWVNGERMGQHEGGHLPFEFELTGKLKSETNRLVVRVNGDLAPNRVPPGDVVPEAEDTFGGQQFPPTSFDFFPYCGIHRPVLLYSVPQTFIEDLTVVTDIRGLEGMVRVTVHSGQAQGLVKGILSGFGTQVRAEAEIKNGEAYFELTVPSARFWSPEHPDLYDLTVELDGEDRYTLPVGIRTFRVDGERLLLNNEPVHLTGFGRHEDFPVTGRGYLPAVIIKDYALMKWVGANSFRTTHYPYSEQMLDMADRLGFLVIDETPAVGLFFSADGLERRRELCDQMTSEVIARDKNHPSVIAWSLANEPHSTRPGAKGFFHDLYNLAKRLDPTRPVTLVSYLGVMGEESFEFLDLICLNRYNGWYFLPGQIGEGVKFLEAELNNLHDMYPNKPFLLTEFGADTIPGHHAQPPEMFSEEYQAEFLTEYIKLLRSKPFVAGEHVWNLCDFKATQAVNRMGGYNYKGVFTRDRRPKLAAHRLRELWKGQ